MLASCRGALRRVRDGRRQSLCAPAVTAIPATAVRAELRRCPASQRLRQRDIVLHTTPQARTRQAYEQRPACASFGTCSVCPIGARYSPGYHLRQALETDRCILGSNVSVRSIVTDPSGRARGLVYQRNDSKQEAAHSARILVVAAGAIESARLLLRSTSSQAPNGLGNAAGHLASTSRCTTSGLAPCVFGSSFTPAGLGRSRDNRTSSSTARVVASTPASS
jgi:choline dehydrogenase-like flavoprotein